jgi:putative transposase
MRVAAETLAFDIGLKSACKALGVCRAGVYRKRGAVKPPQVRSPSPRALKPEEKQGVLDTLHSERFLDLAPHEIYATLLDEEKYLCSISSMYRILRENEEVRERRDQLRHPIYQKPELLATKPGEVWSWDITKLMGPRKWNYFHLYVILDIFSRYVVGWMVASCESATLARRLIEETCGKQMIEPGRLTIHADRGSSMKSKPVALLLTDLGITKTHSRHYTSDDNPFSESQFKTLKYRPDFPQRFGCLEDARRFCQGFFHWYNKEHRHTGICLLTPESVHYGRSEQILESRGDVLHAAYEVHPERFVKGAPSVKTLPGAVWINPPVDGLGTTLRQTEACPDESTGEAINQAAAERSPHIAERSGCRTKSEGS